MTDSGAVRLRLAIVLFALALGALPARAEAARIGYILQVPSYIPAKIDHNIGFIPLNGLDRWPAPRIRSGPHLYIGSWQNALFTRGSLSEALRHLRLIRNTTQNEGAFSDRALTRSERRRFELLADIGRDGDVLVVKAGHPACAGLTFAQARAIATGRTTNWSQVVAGAPADRIAVRHQLWAETFVEPRFGGGIKPRAGRASRNPIADAAADPAVAAVTSWSRARFRRAGVCAVPLNGVAPDDVTVHGLRYPGAYPIGFVVERKRPRNKLARITLREYVRFLESEMAAKMFRGTGMLMVKDTPQAPGSGGGGGEPQTRMRDAQGREVTPVRDDAGVTAALSGERIATQDGAYHWAFEGDSVLRYVEPGPPCSQTESRWTVVEGFRYSEHGGGVIARVRFDFSDGASNEVFLDLPNDPPGTAYMDGTPYTRSRDLAGSC